MTHFATQAEDTYSKTTFGFWVYLMSDCILFATLFATFAVFHKATFGGPGAKELFDLEYALTETLILLVSSFTCGLAMLSAHAQKKAGVIFWYAVTFLLGVAFLTMEIHEFVTMVHDGHGWDKSAFLSAFYTLVSTHGCHITSGLIWILVMLSQVLTLGLNNDVFRRLTCLSMFWHFLDLVWIFIFTVVYLRGVF